MMKTEEKELLVPACDIKGYCHDDLVQMMDYFPVPVFLPEKEEEEKEMECVRGLCGIWYAVKKYDEDEWLEWKDNCSFLDAEGNFYCSIEKTELNDEDRKSLRKSLSLSLAGNLKTSERAHFHIWNSRIFSMLAEIGVGEEMSRFLQRKSTTALFN